MEAGMDRRADYRPSGLGSFGAPIGSWSAQRSFGGGLGRNEIRGTDIIAEYL
jgi:hypothetical protein